MGVLLGTQTLLLKLKSIKGDSGPVLKLPVSFPKDGRTSFKPFGRGIETERSVFLGEEKVGPSSSNVTQLLG